MFGHFYNQVEEKLGVGVGDGGLNQEGYALSLLTDLLDRADVLEMATRSNEMEKKELRRAIYFFHNDCEEARARLYRSGLLRDLEGGPWTDKPSDYVGDFFHIGRLPIAEKWVNKKRSETLQELDARGAS